MRQAVRFSKRYIRPRAILAAVGFSVICWACPTRLEFTDNQCFAGSPRRQHDCPRWGIAGAGLILRVPQETLYHDCRG